MLVVSGGILLPALLLAAADRLLAEPGPTGLCRLSMCSLGEGGVEKRRQVGQSMWRHPERFWACLLLASCLWSRLSLRASRRKGQEEATVVSVSVEPFCPEDVPAAATAPRAIFHALHKTFEELRHLLPELAAAGFDAVQLPPAQVSPVGDLRAQWYLRYQPLRYGAIDPQLGGEAELRRLCEEAEQLGVLVVADCVFNHGAVVASRAEWEAAQRDEGLLEELKGRLDRTFAPELNRDDFQWPWVCLEGDKWDDPAYTYEGWGCGEWSELGFTDRVLGVHFRHLDRLLDCGVRGFRIDAAKHMRPEHVKRYVDYVQQEARSFVYVEVLSLKKGVHAQYEALGTQTMRVHSTDYLLASQMREAVRCDTGGSAYSRLTALSGLGPEGVRFVRSHDTILNQGHAICGIDWASASDARLAWAYLLARPEGSVLLYEDDASVPTVRRALAFRQAVAHRAAVAMSYVPKLAGCCASGLQLHSELRAWPPPTYDLVFLLITTGDHTPLGVAAFNFTANRAPLQLPWELPGFCLREVLAGATREGCPDVAMPLQPASRSTAVDARDVRFFLLERDGVEPVPQPLHSGSGSRSFTLLYFTGWRSPHMHFGLRGHWTPCPGWPFRRAGPPPGYHGANSMGRWWHVEVPLTQGGGPVEFVINDGADAWDHAVGKKNYQVACGGTYVLEHGVLRKLVP